MTDVGDLDIPWRRRYQALVRDVRALADDLERIARPIATSEFSHGTRVACADIAALLRELLPESGGDSR